MIEKQKILVVDDEQDLCEILQFNLQAEGYEVHTASSAEEALRKTLSEYDLLLLDVMMEGMSGFKLAHTIRQEKGIETPIIFLTAKSEENDVLTGFNVGADDYVVKPFSLKEISARVKAVLRRRKKEELAAEVVQIEDLTLDLTRKLVRLAGESIDLTRKEFEIFALLTTYQGRYISREDILERIWKNDVIVTERTVDVNIARLRKKIGRFGEMIKGKTGYGYCFDIE